jgi:S1-C subfamily serine protease
MRRLLVPVALLAAATTACSVTLGSGAVSPAGAENQAYSPLPASSEPVAAVAARVLPAVVNVTTDIYQPDPFGGAQQGQGVGTGFVVRSDGIIVTNCHVVEGASKITVLSSAKNPKEYDARVIGGDCQHDLAVLKIDATGLPTVQLGSSKALQLGQRVVAIGYALALEGGPTVTAGIVSSLHRTIQAQDPNCRTCTNFTRTYADVIQTDAAINHGNSGGPLVDMQGEVVGIDSAGESDAENIGFAIAIDSAKDTIQQAERSPLAPAAYLGVLTQDVTPGLALQFNLAVKQGAYVLVASGDGPAGAAGIKQGDVIVSVAGQAVSSSDDLGRILSTLEPNTQTTLVVVHKDGGRQTISLTLGTRPLPTELP